LGCHVNIEEEGHNIIKEHSIMHRNNSVIQELSGQPDKLTVNHDRPKSFSDIFPGSLGIEGVEVLNEEQESS